MQRLSAEITKAVAAPWVSLSNGVPSGRFPDVITAVCRGGGSGFVAGRASWSRAVGKADPAAELATGGRGGWRQFTERVDRDAVPWWDAGRPGS